MEADGLDKLSHLREGTLRDELEQAEAEIVKFRVKWLEEEKLRRHTEAELATVKKDVLLYAAKHARCEEKLAVVVDKLPSMNDAHWINIVIRRNGKDEVYQADYLKALAKAKEAV